MRRSLAPESSFETLVHLLRARAARQPDDRALTFLADRGGHDRACTYGELDRRARAAAAKLQHLGLSTGDRAVLLYPPGLDFVVAFLGCLYAGVAAVPAYPPELARLTRSMPRLLAIIRDCQPGIVLTTADGLAAATLLGSHRPESPAPRWCALEQDDHADPDGWYQPPLTTDSLTVLQYTSGSTAAPKGVMVTHRNLMHNLAFIQRTFEVGPEDVGVIWLPPYHDMGLIGGILGAFYCGNPLVLLSPTAFLKRPARWLETISRTRAVISGAPNFAYDLCIRRIGPEDRARLDLTSWAVAFVGAEPVRARTLDEFARTFAECGFRRETFLPCFGLAESTLMTSGGSRGAAPVIYSVSRAELRRGRAVAADDDDPTALPLVGCGRASEGHELVVVDAESATPCPAGEVGEVWLSGPSVASGYWNRPDDSRWAFEATLAGTGRGPYLRTGDLGFVHDGELFVTGRLRDLVIRDGCNHYPEDIEETVAQSHPALRVSACAAFSVDADHAERLVILAEVAPKHLQSDVAQAADRRLAGDRHDGGHLIDPGGLDPCLEVRQAIRRAVIERHDLRADTILLVRPGALPKTSSGKLQRHACRTAFLDGAVYSDARWGASDT